MTNRKSAVALGLFDGLHLGHRAVLNLALQQQENGLKPAVFTFSPEAVLRKTSGADGYIYTNNYKYHIISDMGFTEYCSVDFDNICSLSGEEFVENILCRKMNAGAVCCGNDFRFGFKASCGVEDLRKFGRKYGFAVQTAEPVKLNDITVSSTEIRRCLLNGDIETANNLLGNPYAICGTVRHGNEIGRTIDFPTINQDFPAGQLVIKYGVYYTNTIIDNIRYKSVTNIGVKPTIEGFRMPLAETHILDFNNDLYGKNITVEFYKFIRPEMKFSSIDELKFRIAEDTGIVREILI